MPVSLRTFIAVAALAALAGCSGKEPQGAASAPPKQAASAGAPTPPPSSSSPIPLSMPEGHSGQGMAGHPGMGGGGGMPPGMGGGEPEVPMDAKDPAVEKLVAAADAAAAKLKASPADAALKASAAAAYAKAGHEMMLSAKMHRKVKYRGALKLLRDALAIDPKQPQAAGDKKMIEDIYTSMGRPIP